MADSSSIIIVCGVVVTGSTLISDVTKGNITIKPLISGFLLTGALLLIGTFSDGFAQGLAVLIMATALVKNGSELAGVLSAVSGATSTLTNKGA